MSRDWSQFMRCLNKFIANEPFLVPSFTGLWFHFWSIPLGNCLLFQLPEFRPATAGLGRLPYLSPSVGSSELLVSDPQSIPGRGDRLQRLPTGYQPATWCFKGTTVSVHAIGLVATIALEIKVRSIYYRFSSSFAVVIGAWQAISDRDSGPSHGRTFKSATKFVFRSK